MLPICLVKWLAQPVSISSITEDSAEFGCLFRTPCLQLLPETIYSFVHTSKIFTKVSVRIVFGPLK